METTTDADAMEVDRTEKWLPDFVDMVLCISEKASSRMKSRNAVTYGSRTLPFDIAAYAEVRSPFNNSFAIGICNRRHF